VAGGVDTTRPRRQVKRKLLSLCTYLFNKQTNPRGLFWFDHIIHCLVKKCFEKELIDSEITEKQNRGSEDANILSEKKAPKICEIIYYDNAGQSFYVL
jgi:hypothetical protein